MIDTITVALDDFDLAGFIEAYRRLYRSWARPEANPDVSVPAIRHFGDAPEAIHAERDLVGELVDMGWLLFFQVHEPLITAPGLCIDGSHVDPDCLVVGPADGFGFLVEVRDGMIHLHPAFYDGTANEDNPTIVLKDHCGVLDETMQQFAMRFIKR